MQESSIDIEELMLKDPGWAYWLYSCAKKMNDGDFEQWYIDAIVFRNDRRTRYDVVDAYWFIQMHVRLCQEKILFARVDLGKEPAKDDDKRWNNDVLSQAPVPFGGRFKGLAGGNDGEWKWSKTLALPGGKSIPPMSVPLEVGSTEGETTVRHLIESRALARWPYHSKWVYIFYVCDEDLWRPIL